MSRNGKNVAPKGDDHDARWAAICSRDARADGAFVYAVSTTGVYCRPTCGARLPRVEHVAFFHDGGEAMRAGYRPCKRCRPDEAARSVRSAEHMAALCRLIEERLADDSRAPTLTELAAAAGLSPSHTQRLFKATTGLTPAGYGAAYRAQRLRQELPMHHSVTDAIYHAGYGSTARVYERTEALLGMTPSRYRQGGRGLELRVATGRCSLGTILVAATARGLAALFLGDDPDSLVAQLRQRFPHAQLLASDRGLAELLTAAIARVEGADVASSLPLDIQGTAFQQRVWSALAKLPAGATTTYSALAESIGAPTSVRAVAQACGANPVSVVIPCHRVIGRDGTLTGYRWGVERKRALLAREGALPGGDGAPLAPKGALPDREGEPSAADGALAAPDRAPRKRARRERVRRERAR